MEDGRIRNLFFGKIDVFIEAGSNGDEILLIIVTGISPLFPWDGVYYEHFGGKMLKLVMKMNDVDEDYACKLNLRVLSIKEKDNLALS